MTAGESGARPKFVCKITPDALMTARNEGASSLSIAETTLFSMLSNVTAVSSFNSPLTPERRNSASTSRTQATAYRRSTALHTAVTAGRSSSSSTDGNCRSSAVWSLDAAGLAGRAMAPFQHSRETPAIAELYPDPPRPPTVTVAPSRASSRLTDGPGAPRMWVRGYNPVATIDEELSQLERDIRQLKIEYDMYFGGGRKRPPNEVEWRIELLIKRYAERGGDMKFAQRFRFNNLSQTYAKYKDIFRKRMAQREEGTVQRHSGAAAKAIEAERAKAQTAATPAPPSSPAPAATRPNEATAAAAASPQVFRMVCSEPEKEGQKVDQLFDAFVQAKKQAGEETEKLTRSGFNEFVRKKTKDLQSKKNCRDVEYVVETVDGQVKLKALVKSE